MILPLSAQPEDGRSDAPLSQAELERLIAAVGEVSGLLDPVVVATKAAHQARVLSGMDLIGIVAPGPGRSLMMLGSSGAISDWFIRFRVDVDFGQGFMGTIMSSQLPLLFEVGKGATSIHTFNLDTGRQADLVLGGQYASHLAQRLEPEQLHEYVGIPIKSHDSVLGILLAGARGEKPDACRTRVILGRFARMLAPALAAANGARETAASQVAAERQRIAVELHDTIGQILFGIGASAKRSAAFLDGNQPMLVSNLKFIEAESSRAGAHLREIIRTIVQPAGEMELETEVRILAEMFSARTGIAAEVVVSGSKRAVSQGAFVALAAVAREALHNVEKHAGAHAVVVTVHFDRERVSVVVQDDGVGISHAARTLKSGPGTGSGIGLSSLRRRLDRLGGSMSTRRLPGGGTVVSATLSFGEVA